MKKNIDSIWNPDTLTLSKDEILDFLNLIESRWKKNFFHNKEFIMGLEGMKLGIKFQREETIRKIWGAIIAGFNELQYENGIAKMKEQGISWADTKAKIKKKIESGEMDNAFD